MNSPRKPPGKSQKSAVIVLAVLLVAIFLFFGSSVFLMSGTKASFSFVPVDKLTPPGGHATTTTTTKSTTTTAPTSTSPAGTGGR